MANLFVGVWPPPAIVRALAAYPRPPDDDGGWSMPAQWLVNVRPLGRVTDPAIVGALVDTLGFELSGMPKPTARLTTPRHGEWLRTPVEGLEELTEVVFDVTEPIVPRTHSHKEWEVSIGLRRTRSPRDLVHPLQGRWKVGEVVLATGVRSRAGYGYETLHAFSLG